MSIRCRQIAENDRTAIVELLAKGFPQDQAFWSRALDRLRTHPTPPEMPKYGYLLESDDAVVGVLLLISTAMQIGGARTIRANVSSWYVEPAFRTYAGMLSSQAIKRRDVTYLNVTAAPNTWPLLEAQGYKRYTNGIFVAIPTLRLSAPPTRVKLVPAQEASGAAFDPFEKDLLLRHADYGCISLWAVTREEAHPFVFRSFVAKMGIKAAHLIYCRAVEDFVRLARPIGWWLALRGKPLVVIDANGPIPGLIGRYYDENQPKYFKGPGRPRAGDLAYTEIVMFGL